MNTTLPTPTAAAEHIVTHLSGGRADEDWTAQCSCGTRFKSTHNAHLRRAITRHLNKVASEATSEGGRA